MIDVVSGGFTVLTILMGMLVLVHWIKPAYNGIKNKGNMSSEQWLILGVVIAFLGQMFDNMYWLITWTSNYFDSSTVLNAWLFEHGPMANLPFRQASGILAAYCHVYAAVMVDESQTRKFQLLVLAASFIGIMFSLGMVFFKY